MSDATDLIGPQAPAVENGFDYSTLPADVATEAQDVARRIRVRMEAFYFDTGRDLVAVSEQMPHGTFGDWLRLEFGMSVRTAQRLMSAARAVAKYDTLSLLPPTVVYDLAAPSTPETFVAEIDAAVRAGERLSVKEIKDRRAEAVEADKHLKVQAGKSSEQIERERNRIKRQEAVYQRHQAEFEKTEEHRAAKANTVAAFLVNCLGAGGVVDLVGKMHGTDWFRVEQQFRNFKIALLSEAEISAKFGAEQAPVSTAAADAADYLVSGLGLDGAETVLQLITTISVAEVRMALAQRSQMKSTDDATSNKEEWQNVRDFCLTKSNLLTPTQQQILASLGRRGPPTQNQLEQLAVIRTRCTGVAQ